MGEASNRDRRLFVFAQQAQAVLDIEGWNAHGERFFDTRIGLAEPLANGGRLVVAPEGLGPGVRAVEGRARSEDDLTQARLAEEQTGGGGLGALARRCPVVWLIERESATDVLALRLATVMASALLGPILDPETAEIFGVKTARIRISAAAYVTRS